MLEESPGPPALNPIYTPAFEKPIKQKQRQSIGTTQQPLLSQQSEEHQTKRRRTAENITEWGDKRSVWQQPYTPSSAGQPHKNSPAGQEIRDVVQRPWATVNDQPPPASHPLPQIAPQVAPQAQPQIYSNNHGMNGYNRQNYQPPLPAPASSQQSSSGGWATINQPAPAPPQPSQSSYYNGTPNSSVYQQSKAPHSRPEDVQPAEDESILIDMLPKNKQRQVYGLVAGIQGGIEHLQRELDSLKRAFGIEDED